MGIGLVLLMLVGSFQSSNQGENGAMCGWMRVRGHPSQSHATSKTLSLWRPLSVSTASESDRKFSLSSPLPPTIGVCTRWTPDFYTVVYCLGSSIVLSLGALLGKLSYPNSPQHARLLHKTFLFHERLFPILVL
jgi:hypothetical protein